MAPRTQLPLPAARGHIPAAGLGAECGVGVLGFPPNHKHPHVPNPTLLCAVSMETSSPTVPPHRSLVLSLIL